VILFLWTDFLEAALAPRIWSNFCPVKNPEADRCWQNQSPVPAGNTVYGLFWAHQKQPMFLKSGGQLLTWRSFSEVHQQVRKIGFTDESAVRVLALVLPQDGSPGCLQQDNTVTFSGYVLSVAFGSRHTKVMSFFGMHQSQQAKCVTIIISDVHLPVDSPLQLWQDKFNKLFLELKLSKSTGLSARINGLGLPPPTPGSVEVGGPVHHHRQQQLPCHCPHSIKELACLQWVITPLQYFTPFFKMLFLLPKSSRRFVSS
jgi:hypothetical protein